MLDLLQHDSGRTLHDLGEQVGLSPSAVQRRIARYRKDGLITRQIAVLDPHRSGPTILATVLVTLAEESFEHHREFAERMRAEPQVQQAYRVAGPWDYVVVLAARSMRDCSPARRPPIQSGRQHQAIRDPGRLRHHQNRPGPPTSRPTALATTSQTAVGRTPAAWMAHAKALAWPVERTGGAPGGSTPVHREVAEAGCAVLVTRTFDGPAPNRARALPADPYTAETGAPAAGGLIATPFYNGLDGSHMLNYALWTTTQAHKAAIEHRPPPPADDPLWQRAHTVPRLRSTTFRRCRPLFFGTPDCPARCRGGGPNPPAPPAPPVTDVHHRALAPLGLAVFGDAQCADRLANRLANYSFSGDGTEPAGVAVRRDGW
ncbi:Lrp/AsnC family transcriptional regulator [Actinomadura madurae]|nr:Lrp/AsnC family transcriptional regulator [Actinomadura madurae]